MNSNVPIVRADWFLYQTAASFRRGGAGYYDFLGIKSRKDAEKLGALDVDLARSRRKEIAALLDESGVAINNRQILWFKTFDGSWWETLDADESKGKQNALRLYDGDFDYQAVEVYFSIPNGLFGFLAASRAGELQDTVPDTIASDDVPIGRDHRIHTGFSCVRCHVEGIRPIDDWARATYDGPLALASYDAKKLKRLKQLYLSDLPAQVKKDQRAYEEVLAKLNGTTPQENARLYDTAFKNFFTRKVMFEDACREWGYDVKEARVVLEIYARPENKGADQVLASIVHPKFRGFRREHFEELFALGHTVIRGALSMKTVAILSVLLLTLPVEGGGCRISFSHRVHHQPIVVKEVVKEVVAAVVPVVATYVPVHVPLYSAIYTAPVAPYKAPYAAPYSQPQQQQQPYAYNGGGQYNAPYGNGNGGGNGGMQQGSPCDVLADAIRQLNGRLDRLEKGAGVPPAMPPANGNGTAPPNGGTPPSEPVDPFNPPQQGGPQAGEGFLQLARTHCGRCHDASSSAAKGKGFTLLSGGRLAQLTPEQVGSIIQQVSSRQMPPGNMPDQDRVQFIAGLIASVSQSPKK